MQLSEKGTDFLKSYEKLRLKPYDDQTGKEITEWCKGATIGYGHLISKREWDELKTVYCMGITKYYANMRFISDLNRFEDCVNECVKTDISQHQYDALVIFAFNIGVSAFRTSSALKLVNDPRVKTKYAGLESAWKAYKKSNGEVNEGLINRRAAEWRIYTQGIYER